jgi:hypothetical protein
MATVPEHPFAVGVYAARKWFVGIGAVPARTAKRSGELGTGEFLVTIPELGFTQEVPIRKEEGVYAATPSVALC